MVDQIRHWGWLGILCGLFALVCVLGAGWRLARALGHMVHDVVGGVHSRAAGGWDLPRVTAIDEWGQALSVPLLLALVWLLVDEQKPRNAYPIGVATPRPSRESVLRQLRRRPVPMTRSKGLTVGSMPVTRLFLVPKSKG